MTGLAIGCMIWAILIYIANYDSNTTLAVSYRAVALLVFLAAAGYLIEAMI
jgi:hypothetical protein